MSAHHPIASGSTAPLGLTAPARAEGERFQEGAPDTPATLGSRKRSRSSPREASGEREQEYQVGEDGELLQRPNANADHRSYTTWIPEEDKQLSELLATNKPWDEIAKAFPWRTKVSVMNRLYKMESTDSDGAKSPRKRRVPPGVKRSDHHKWDEEGLATLKALATDRKTSWAEIGQRCGGLTGKTVEGKWRRMSLKERSDDSAAGAAPSSMFKAKPRRSKPGPLCLAEREAALEPEHEPAEGQDGGTSTPFRSPAFASKKKSLDSIERDQAGTNGTAIFGYGSLIFKPPPFEGLTSEPGYIKGHVRRFAQWSHDHRGTPERPGRVVTLLTSEEWAPHRVDEPLESDHVWGQIYRIPEDLAPTVWPYLDHREKDGYTMRIVDVWGIRDGKEVVIEAGCRVYVGETDNPSFAGATPMRELAKVMASSVGPSGANREYLYLLCDAVRKLSPLSEDLYLKELERLVREEEASL